MSPKYWIILIVSFLAFAILLMVTDAIFAGILFIVVFLFDANVAGIVFKWVWLSLLLLELPTLFAYLYRTLKYERNDI